MTDEDSRAFDPTDFGFMAHARPIAPGDVNFFEYRNHPHVNGAPDILRLNLYLTQSADYVFIWWGLIMPVLAEERFRDLVEQHGFRFDDMYSEDLFCGYISSAAEAKVILNALRISSAPRYQFPQVLCGAPDDLRCESLERSPA